MRVFVTGGAGFIGLAVVRRLVARGDRVVAMVRDPERAGALRDLGVEVRGGDLSRAPAIVDAMRGNETAIHMAGAYRIGIPAKERPLMLDSNVGATSRVLDAAATAGLERLIYISTCNVFGNTEGRIVDEKYRRDVADGFLSYYDETKYLAHRAVEERIGSGAPIAIAMPGAVYGPRDHSGFGQQLKGAHDGTLGYRALGRAGISAVHVDDVASGIVAVHDRGRLGEAYVLGGQNVRLEDALKIAARLGGHRLPPLVLPDRLVRVGSLAPRLDGQARRHAREPRRGAAQRGRRHVLGLVSQGRRGARVCPARCRERAAGRVRR